MKHFICFDLKPAWFEKLYQLNMAAGMADSKEKWKRANREFDIIIETFNFIRRKPNNCSNIDSLCTFEGNIVCIGVSKPHPWKHHLLFSLRSVLNLQTVQTSLFRQFPNYILVFVNLFSKNWIFHNTEIFHP